MLCVRLVWFILILLISILLAHGSTYTNKSGKLTEVPTDIPASVSKINLGNNKITSIGNNAFSDFANMTSIELNSNKISDISASAFFGLKKLRKINLNGNVLQSIPAFESVANTLHELELRYNLLTDDGIDTLSEYTALQTVKLNGNQLTMLPLGIIELQKLGTIDITKNEIIEVPDTSSGNILPSLKTFSLNEASLSNDVLNDILEKYFHSPHPLETLQLQTNLLTNIPSVLSGRFPLLKDLDVSNNPLTSFDAVLYPSIEKITISGGAGFVIPSLFLDYFPNITKLSITNAKVTDIPFLTSVVSNVEEIHFTSNEISSLQPGLFTDCLKLKTLKLSDNKLSTIPVGLFSNSSSLEHVALNSNSITLIESGAFEYLDEVTKFEITHNKLVEFPMEISQLYSVQDIHLSSNNLATIPDAGLVDLHKITHLRLQYNKLSQLPNLTSNHSNILYFNFKRNLISYCPDDYFQGMRKLQYLNMEINQLTRLPNLSSLKRLGNIEAAQNKISEIPNGYLFELERLVKLNLQRNDLNLIDLEQYNLNITELHLNDNPVTFFPKIKSCGNTLQKLYIQECDILSMPEDFAEYFRALEILDISSNNLTAVPDLSLMDSLREVDLRKNMFDCEEDLCWMKTEDISSISISIETAPCYSPEALVGIEWDEIEVTEVCRLCASIPAYAHISPISKENRLPDSVVKIECAEGYSMQHTNQTRQVKCDDTWSWKPFSPVFLTCVSDEPEEEEEEVPPVEAQYSTLLGILGLIFVLTEVGFFVFLDLTTIGSHIAYARESLRQGMNYYCRCCKEEEAEEALKDEDIFSIVSEDEDLDVISITTTSSLGLPWLYRNPTPCLDLSGYAHLIWSPVSDVASSNVSLISLGSSVHLSDTAVESNISPGDSMRSSVWLIPDHKKDDDSISQYTIDLGETWLQDYIDIENGFQSPPNVPQPSTFPPIEGPYGDRAPISAVIEMVPDYLFSVSNNNPPKSKSRKKEAPAGLYSKPTVHRSKKLKSKIPLRKKAPRKQTKPSEYVKARLRSMYAAYS